MPPSHKRGVFRTFVHRKKTSPREVESLYHKKSPLVNSCGRFFRIFRRPAEERRGGRENLRRDTPPAHTASGGAARRTVEFVAGYAAHVPGGTASGKTDAAGSRGRIPTSGEGTDSQIPPSVCASRAGLAVSHLSSVSEAGRATLFVYRVGHAVPSAFVSDAVSLCSVCCLTSSPASPRRLDRSAAPVIMSARPRLPPRWTRSLARFPARGRFPRTCVPAPRIGFGRCALLLPLFRIGCEYVPPPPRAPFSPNTYPAWGAEHPRAGARRAP